MDIVTKLTSTCIKMQDGSADIPGIGEKRSINYVGSPADIASEFTIQLTDGTTQVQTQIGAGDLTGITPTFCMTYAGKVYILGGSSVYFSAIDSPTVFNDPNAIGNGFVSMANQVKTPEDLVAVTTYQGRLVFFSRQTTQIWQTPADPTQWAIQQVLQNIGTIAKESVQPMGDIDVMFHSDTGVRSLKARDITLNAFVDDLGSPIDSLVRAAIAADLSTAQLACGIVEPTTGQYWLFLRDTIYVFSHYPSAKVVAWSTYEPTDNEGSFFTPERFVVLKGQVYCRAGDKIYQYGGSNNNTYDATPVVIETPWLDLKSPGIMKSAEAINAMFVGEWTISIGMDPVSGILESNVWTGTDHTYDKGIVPVSGIGSHFKARMVSLSSDACIFSSLVFHYGPNEEV